MKKSQLDLDLDELIQNTVERMLAPRTMKPIACGTFKLKRQKERQGSLRTNYVNQNDTTKSKVHNNLIGNYKILNKKVETLELSNSSFHLYFHIIDL